MDSANSSGSMQYSSGGDEEYDSSAFLNSNPNQPHFGDGTVAGLPRHHQLQPPQAALHSLAPSMFDSLSNFLDPTRSASLAGPILNLDMAAWYKSPRPDPNCTDLTGFGLAPMQLPPQPLFAGAGTTSFPVPSEPEGLRQLGSISGSTPNEQAPVNTTSNNSVSSNGNPVNTLARNPRKRSRASRRAPTTVLTTDTTNFRAMVQEFTGIPAQPFTAPPFQRSRLDLFGSASGSPSYILRPFAQKQQPPAVPPFAPPSLASSNSSSSSFPASIISALASTSTGNSMANPDLGLLRLPPSFLNQNMANPVLDFQSLFQAPGQNPIADSSIFPAKTLRSSDILASGPNSHMKVGVLEDFGLSHGQVSTQLQPGLPNLEPSDRTLSDDDNNNNNNNNDHNPPPPNWLGDGAGPKDGSSQVLLRPLDGNFGRVGDGDRGLGKGGARGEGMVESWICSSPHRIN